jgi:hypothetical protein
MPPSNLYISRPQPWYMSWVPPYILGTSPSPHDPPNDPLERSPPHGGCVRVNSFKVGGIPLGDPPRGGGGGQGPPRGSGFIRSGGGM